MPGVPGRAPAHPAHAAFILAEVAVTPARLLRGGPSGFRKRAWAGPGGHGAPSRAATPRTLFPTCRLIEGLRPRRLTTRCSGLGVSRCRSFLLAAELDIVSGLNDLLASESGVQFENLGCKLRLVRVTGAPAALLRGSDALDRRPCSVSFSPLPRNTPSGKRYSGRASLRPEYRAAQQRIRPTRCASLPEHTYFGRARSSSGCPSVSCVGRGWRLPAAPAVRPSVRAFTHWLAYAGREFKRPLTTRCSGLGVSRSRSFLLAAELDIVRWRRG